MSKPNDDNSPQAYTYHGAGVDIARGDALVNAIKPLASATTRPGVMGSLGGFGGLFDLKAAGFTDPVLVAATDGVGTKLKLATAVGQHDTIGIDLVAMCVNDLIVQGAEPLFFLDYYATSSLELNTGQVIIKGIADGCRLAGCALIGGETAEMPGHYAAGDYDLAGFAVGAAERDALLPRSDIEIGDILFALPSSGVHSNGFSLVRRLVSDFGFDYDDTAPFDPGRSLGSALLTPTRIYVQPVLDALRARAGIKALAHITGGGLPENLPRILPDDLAAEVQLDRISPPSVFAWLQDAGKISTDEMLRTFNCGIGMVIIGPAGLRDTLAKTGEPVIEIGQVTKRDAGKPVNFSGNLMF